MKHRLTALLFAVLVLALAAFTGSAFAGDNGHGNGNGGGNGNSANAPGHQDQSAPAATPAPSAPATSAPAASAPSSKHEDHAAKHEDHAASHESKQSSTSASNPATGGSNSQGVKPSNTTKHDTYAKASSDQTKQYGNGKTAGQIATPAATATPAAPATATPAAAGAVKGAVVTLKPTKTKPAGGVLGTTTRLGGTVASTKLPFTGLSLWIFVLVAAALIAIGATVRRSAARRTY